MTGPENSTGTAGTTRSTLAIRFLIGAVGVGITGYGIEEFLKFGFHNLVETFKWLIGGLVLNDGVIAAAVLAIAFVLGRIFRGRIPAPLIIGLLVLASVSLAALPMIGRYGARVDNPTLLPRNYVAGWFIFAGLTLLFTTVALVLGRRSTKGATDGTRTGS
jgi:hypothetical protein